MIAVLQDAESFVTISIPHCFQTDATYLLLTTLNGKGFFTFSFVLSKTFLRNEEKLRLFLTLVDSYHAMLFTLFLVHRM